MDKFFQIDTSDMPGGVYAYDFYKLSKLIDSGKELLIIRTYD